VQVRRVHTTVNTACVYINQPPLYNRKYNDDFFVVLFDYLCFAVQKEPVILTQMSGIKI
jgi:hypothetical protein